MSTSAATDGQTPEAINGEAKPTSGPARLVGYLYAQAAGWDSRKALMEMRSSLGARDGIAPSAVAYVAAYAPVPDPRATGPGRREQIAREKVTYLVAALFSLWHVNHAPAPQLDKSMGVGKALKALARTDSVAAAALLSALTRLPQDQIGRPCQRLVTVIGLRGIRLDWTQLAYDLTAPSPKFREAQRRWARDFHASSTIAP